MNQVTIITGILTSSAAFISAVISSIKFGQDIKSRNKQNEIKEKEQASKICAYIDGNENVCIMNSSELPIYNVVITALHGVENRFQISEEKWKEELALDTSEQDCGKSGLGIFDLVPPGKYISKKIFISHAAGDSFFSKTNRIEIAFTDNLSNSWVKRQNGKLDKIKCNPYEYYKIKDKCKYSLDDCNLS